MLRHFRPSTCLRAQKYEKRAQKYVLCQYILYFNCMEKTVPTSTRPRGHTRSSRTVPSDSRLRWKHDNSQTALLFCVMMWGKSQRCSINNHLYANSAELKPFRRWVSLFISLFYLAGFSHKLSSRAFTSAAAVYVSHIEFQSIKASLKCFIAVYQTNKHILSTHFHNVWVSVCVSGWLTSVPVKLTYCSTDGYTVQYEWL